MLTSVIHGQHCDDSSAPGSVSMRCSWHASFSRLPIIALDKTLRCLLQARRRCDAGLVNNSYSEAMGRTGSPVSSKEWMSRCTLDVVGDTGRPDFFLLLRPNRLLTRYLIGELSAMTQNLQVMDLGRMLDLRRRDYIWDAFKGFSTYLQPFLVVSERV
ncbi:hypothetical protein EXIGLDRAFT_735819 [Exidia glandulosa HHB12029]|uniref:Uncharacterized protein n=1 Tax=Exidia glandulosa HHB12029 TaxID=1314781 RepID=A0A165JR50_EXIGL|nr:hypothetical protein EXIGLDRAFT_735819 [Exidia glandulosa HHB12029]